MLPDWAPDLLAFAGQAPLALLLFAVAVDILALLRPKWDTGPAAALSAYVGAFAATLTIYLAAPEPSASASGLSTLFDTHTLYLWYTLLFTGIYALVRFGITFVPAVDEQMAARIPLILIAAGGVYLAWQTTTARAELVYRHGVGVEAVQRLQQEAQAAAGAGPQGFVRDGDAWYFEPRTPGAWKQNMTWVDGSPTSVQSFMFEPEGDGPAGLALYLQGETVLFTGPSELRTADIRATLNLDAFDGTVDIVYNVRGAAFYDYVQLNNNQIRLARREGSAVRIQDAADYSLQGWRSYRIQAGRTSFRGFVGDQMVVAGTDTPASAGTVGLRLRGTGLVRLRSLSVQPLAETAEASSENGASSQDGPTRDTPPAQPADTAGAGA